MNEYMKQTEGTEETTAPEAEVEETTDESAE